MTKLRGHHLICLHFFRGEGYDQEFIDNLMSMLDDVRRQGAEIREGVDDICRRCPYLEGGRCRHNEDAEDEIREMDRTALMLLNMTAGMRVDWSGVGEMLPALFHDWYQRYCHVCDWKGACVKDRLYQELEQTVRRE